MNARLSAGAMLLTASGLLAACGSGSSEPEAAATLDQPGACSAWMNYLDSEAGSTPPAPTDFVEAQFTALADAYRTKAALIRPISEGASPAVDEALRTALGNAYSSAAEIADNAAAAAKSLSPEDVDAIIAPMNTHSEQIEAISAICTG